MNRTKRFTHWLMATLIMLVSTGLAAQTPEADDDAMYGTGAAFARLYAVEGSARLERDAREPVEAVSNLTIEPLDVLSTGPDGRAVILFMDGTMLKLNHDTRLEFLEIGNMADTPQLTILARLWHGNLVVDVSDDAQLDNRSFRLDTEDASLYFLANGKYRVDKLDTGTRLKVVSGAAELSNGQASRLLHAGEQGIAERGYTTIRTAYFNTFDMDPFDVWAMNNFRRSESVSSQYVPAEIRHYTVELDNYGSWYYDTGLATYVWRPNIIVSDWTPYSNGYWEWSPYGMTWVSYYPWGWAPFHYGAWEWSISFGWVWIPGRVYSPGWVTWCYWDNYVGWYPYNRYYRRHHPHLRGRVVAHRPRRRVVVTSVDRLHVRKARFVTRDIPSGRNVVRVERPIAPDRGKLVRNPGIAVREAVKRPVTRKVVAERTVRIRNTAVSRPGGTVVREAAKTRTREALSARERATTVRTPVIRNQGSRFETRGGTSVRVPSENRTIRRNTTIDSGRTTGTVREKTGTRAPVIRNQDARSKSGSDGIVIRRPEPSRTVRPSTGRSTTISHRSSTRSGSSSSWRRSTTVKPPTVKPRSTTIRPRTTTIKPRSTSPAPRVKPKTTVRPRTTVKPRSTSTRSHSTRSSSSSRSRSTSSRRR